MTILRIDASANSTGSVTRDLTDRIIATFEDADVVTRDLAADPLPQITSAWITARTVPPAERSPEQTAELVLSDALIAEIEAAETVVIGVPVYNFSIPAALKAWIDLVARPGVTFRYTSDGPVGLLKGKRVILAVASGGTGVGSEIDFATGYLHHVLGFIGLDDVQIIAADQMAIDPDAALTAALGQIATLPAAA